ncbi:MAG: ATP-binding protein, partial [Phaeodactylibacter sp.]|nr:ATP-binding protein [Phaeodactylibacter sp.]
MQCGLASQLETVDWLPFFIRKGEDINRSLNEALQKVLKGERFDTYAETIKELYAQYERPIYLLFDQFEELFILGTPEEQAAFFKTISTLVDAR